MTRYDLPEYKSLAIYQSIRKFSGLNVIIYENEKNKYRKSQYLLDFLIQLPYYTLIMQYFYTYRYASIRMKKIYTVILISIYLHSLRNDSQLIRKIIVIFLIRHFFFNSFLVSILILTSAIISIFFQLFSINVLMVGSLTDRVSKQKKGCRTTHEFFSLCSDDLI